MRPESRRGRLTERAVVSIERLPVAQLQDVALDVPEPDLRPREVAQQADVTAHPLGRIARDRDQLARATPACRGRS